MGPDPDIPGYTASCLVKPGKKVAHEMTVDDKKEAIEAYASDAEILRILVLMEWKYWSYYGYLIDNFFGKEQIQEKIFMSEKRSNFVKEITKQLDQSDK